MPPIGPENFSKKPVAKKSAEGTNQVETPLGPESDFSWLQTLTTLHHENAAADEDLPQSRAFATDDKVLDIAEYRPTAGTSRQEANKLDLDRRIAAGPPLDTMRISPPPTGAAMDAQKNGLMGSLFPYIAAAFFFAIITAGAIFYFVAIRLPERSAQDGPQLASSPSSYGNATLRNDIAQDPAVAETNPLQPMPKPDPQMRPGSTSRPSPITPAIEVRSSIAPPSLTIADGSAIGVGSEPTSNSFASAAMANLNIAAPAKAKGFLEGGADVSVSRHPDPSIDSQIQQPEGKIASLPPKSAVADPVETDNQQRQVAPANTLPASQAPADTPAAKGVESQPASNRKMAATASPSAPKDAPQVPLSRSASITSTEPSKPAKEAARPVKSISQDLEVEYLARGRETLQSGDIAGARLLFQYLVDQGSAAGAYAMGQTYDPAMLGSLGVRGMKGNAKTARTWYETAASMGNAEAMAKVQDATRQ